MKNILDKSDERIITDTYLQVCNMHFTMKLNNDKILVKICKGRD